MTLIQLVGGSEPLTRPANQRACRLEKGRRTCAVSGWCDGGSQRKGSSSLTRCHLYRTAGCDLKPPAVHSHSLFPHPASKPNTPFVIRPSILYCHPHTTKTTLQSVLEWQLPGRRGRIWAILRRRQIQTVGRGEEDSPCGPEVCLPDTVWTDLCVCV